MAGHSRPKDGVASLAYVPAIHVFPAAKTWMPGTRPGMTSNHHQNVWSSPGFITISLLAIPRLASAARN
jgi:hypothetical protein